MKASLFRCTAVVVLFSLVFTGAGWAQEKADKPAQESKEKVTAKQVKCPVSGDPVDFRFSVMTDIGPVYFCCPKCPKEFTADTKKYEMKVKEQQELLAKLPKVQVACPVSGKPIDKEQFVEKDGQRVYFCSAKCTTEYKADPAEFKAKLMGCYTYQTHCPVTGEEIDPTASAELPDGNRVYYCCMACDPKVRAEPAKYVKKLEEQGTYIDAKKIAAAGKAGKAEKPEAKDKESEPKHEEKH